MIEMEEKLYNNKYGVRATISTIKILRKLQKILDQEKEKTKVEFEQYQKSEEYEKLVKAE